MQKTQDSLYYRSKHYYGLWTGILARSNALKLKCLCLWMNLFITNIQLLLKLAILVALHANHLSKQNQLLIHILHKMLTDGLEWCGSLVDYCDVFISCLDFRHSDGTHSLQTIQTPTSLMAWGWVTVIFGWTTPLRSFYILMWSFLLFFLRVAVSLVTYNNIQEP